MTIIKHNDIEWNVAILPFDNGDWQGGTFGTNVTSELVEDMPDLLEQWTGAILGHILGHHPAQYGWRRHPELIKDPDYETQADNYYLRCRAYWSKETAEHAQEIRIANDLEGGPEAVGLTLGQQIDAQRGSL